jgi:nuclease S1
LKRVLLYFLLVSTIVGPAAAPSVRAWGCKGHQTVALLAEKHLTADAKLMVDALLSGNPIDPALRRYCGSVGLDAMADASTWADDERSKDPSTGPWHFLDVPLDFTPENKIDQFCGAGGCVTQALTQQIAILKDKTATPANRATALRFVIHFVGDLHQPLHTTDNDDRGANCVSLKYFRRNPHVKNNFYTPNLHHVWDTEIVERQMEGADPEEFATTLESIFADSFAEWQQGGVQVDAWAWEGHQHAVDTVYGALPVRIAAEPANVTVKTCADDNNIGLRMLHKHVVVGAAYQDVAGQVAEERLAQAGIRLALILNEVAKSIK